MKKLLSFIFLLSSSVVSGQNELSSKDSADFFGPTEKGVPDGEKVSREIGAEGGKLVSSDGRVELIIPAGALSSNTTISIQPITNLAQGGAGKAYNFEPSGIKFQQPVQLVFHYSDKEMNGDSPQLMGIAYQDEKGSWYGIRNLKLDTDVKTITGNINHFSGWSLRWTLLFYPEATRVKVTKKVTIIARLTPIGEEIPGDYKEIIAAVYGPNISNPRIWSVNGIPGGDANNGTIGGEAITRQDYKAPATVPDKNPVEVMFEILGAQLEDGSRFTYTRKCNIRVYDNCYEVKMISKMSGSAGTVLGDMSYSDEGSFIVSLEGKKSRITDIKNNMEELIYNGSCKTALMNPGRNTGTIHITGTPVIKVTAPQPPGQEFPIVEITFVQSMAVNSMLMFTCPKIPPAQLPAMGGPTLPYKIKFNAKEGEQVIQEVGDRKRKERVYYKFTVKQLTED
jgi:hypothetical protein